MNAREVVSVGSEHRALTTRTPRWRGWAAAGLVLLGALRIVSTYRELSETVDEPAHIGAGMEWLALGRYTFELQHPPLARIAAAAGPYLLGIREQRQTNLWNEGRHVLYADNAYLRNLTAARLGILPFFALAAFLIWRIGRDAFGSSVALGAVACFTLLPPVLAHFGVATTDGPMFAMFAASTYAMLRWLRGPTLSNGLALGAATSLAVMAKFSAVPYLGGLAILLATARFWSARFPRRSTAESLGDGVVGETRGPVEWSWPRTVASLVVAGAVAFVVAWAVYRFTIGTVRGIPMPLAEIPKGIRDVAEHNRNGHPAYFLGEVRARGIWYFFPVIIALKTPLVALALGFAGFIVLIGRARRTKDWVPLLPVLVAIAVVGVAVTAGINIGVRHVLPFYLGLALATGIGWQWAWSRLTTSWARAGLIGAAAVASIGTLTVHPDYLAYFSALAGRDPSRLVADSDLDWGQDMFRLRREAQARGIDTLQFAYIGTADLSPIIGVPVKFWDGSGRPSGWVAVSETWYRRGEVRFVRGQYRFKPDALFWMDSAATFARVGNGIRLYRLPSMSPSPTVAPQP